MVKKWTCIILFFFFSSSLVYPQTFNSGYIGASIPDGSNLGIYFSLVVSSLPGTIDYNFGLESICMDINHSYDGQLIVWLEAPDGTLVEITTNNGFTGDNYTNSCFKAMVPDFVTTGIAPFTGTYRPEGDLSDINNGQNPNGVWKLFVMDDVPLEVGIFNSWSLTFSSSPAKPFDFTDSNLPIIIINTNNKTIGDDDKIMVDLGIIYNGSGQRNYTTDPFNHYNGKAGIEFRGSSSQMFPKKSYSLETWDNSGNKLDTSLFGMPSEHDWVLYAPYTDKTLIRNTLSYKLFSDMEHYSVRTQYAELVLNGQYQGVYVFTEKIKRDKDRVNIAKLTANDTSGDDITGGYIIKIDRINGNGGEGWYSGYPSNITGDSAVYFQYEYPSQDSLLQIQKDYIKNYVDSFENVLTSSDFNNPVNGYRKYISMTSFLDYFIINELSKNADGYRLSAFLHKDKASKGGKLKNGPIWDFDIAWNNAYYNGGDDPNGWQWQWQALEYFIPFWWTRFMQDSSFVNDLYCRYISLRANVLDTVRINKYIDSLAFYLNESQIRNFQYYPILGTYVWPNTNPIPVSYEGEITKLKDWLVARVSWMDANISGICNIMNVANYKCCTNSFKVFPNPCADDVMQISYEVFETSRMKLELLNLLGMQLKTYFNEDNAKGNYNREILLDNLNPGGYILKLTANEKISYQKIIKLN